jgi:predicted nuclease of restriction endonuclease-like (RecB) superfamily
LIESARRRAAAAVNFELTLLYWRIGVRIRKEILKEKRADYGRKIVTTLSAQLAVEYGNGFSRYNLSRMIQFGEYFPREEIVVTLSQQLGWSHFVAIFPVSDPLAREFYAELCRIERWSVRALRKKIAGMLFERTALSKKPEIIIKKELSDLRRSNQMTPDLVFHDPYILDFLELNDSYLEKDLEDAILRELQQFLLELGSGFSFIARQYRMQIDDDDFYLDLLF